MLRDVFGRIEPLINQQGFVRFWDSTAAAPYLLTHRNRGRSTFGLHIAVALQTAVKVIFCC
jgi:hypothetical protein